MTNTGSVKSTKKNRFPTFAIITLLLISSTLLSLSLSNNDTPVDGYNSLDGTSNIEDIAGARIIGQLQNDVNGRMGSTIGFADINGDGYDDLYTSAPAITGVPGVLNTGRCYIWYGGSELPVGNIDIDENSPDIVIRGSSLDSQIVGNIKAGDIDNDGYTDMVIGNPKQPESGKVFILWGKPAGWPSLIDLYPIAGNQPNAYPVGFRNTNDEVIISGQVTTNVLGTHLGQELVVHDIDMDGFDDVIFSFHGWNAVMICWGRSNRLTFGDDLTYIRANAESSNFGKQVKLGDIDGDGTSDLAVSSPIIEDDSRIKTQCGAVSVYFNISGLKGMGAVSANIGLRPRIWGKDSYDKFGSSLFLTDLNHDGKDDIIIGAPGADGPSNSRMDCGQIYVIYGDNITTFPSEFIGEDQADKIVHGKTQKIGNEPGSGLGQMFATGDIDSDGEYELIAGFPSTDEGTSENIGKVEIYETRDFLTFAGSINDLYNVIPRMEIFGNDPYDNLGMLVVSTDLNNDGADEVFVSSPSADGPSNTKAECGEVYLLPGSNLRIRDMKLSGEGYLDGIIYSGLGNVRIDIPLIANDDAGIIDTISLNIDPDGLNITFSITDDTIIKMNDPFDLLTVDEGNSGITSTMNRGDLVLDLETSLFLYSSREPVVIVSFNTTTGQSISRTFVEPFTIVRDLILSGPVKITEGDSAEYSVTDWFAMGDEIEMFGPVIYYDNDENNVKYSGSEVLIQLHDDKEDLQADPVDGWYINKELVDGMSGEMDLEMIWRTEMIPPGYAQIMLPELSGKRSFQLRIDSDTPSNVTGLEAVPDQERGSSYDDDPIWGIKWAEEVSNYTLDEGSGVKEFLVSSDGSNWTSASDDGGLWATYFDGRNFDNEVSNISEVDGPIDHSLSEWGEFSPNLRELNHDNYSIRWHGWFRPLVSKDHKFAFSGHGEVMMMLDGNVHLDWTDLETDPVANPVYLELGKVFEVIILFKCREISSFTFRLEDSRGFMLPVSASQLLYPSNFTEIEVEDVEQVEISVVSVDWVGLVSDASLIQGSIDHISPGFDLSSISNWYPIPEPTLKVSIFDPELTMGPGSGVDVESIQYRTKQRDAADFSEWMEMDDTNIILDGIDGPVSIISSIKLDLEVDWRGIVQFRASDMVGNSATSSFLDIGIDQIGPLFEVLEPNLLVVQKEGVIDFIVKATDRPGAGVNGSSIEMRYGLVNEVMSDWIVMNSSGINEELIATLGLHMDESVYNIQFRAFDSIGNLGISSVMELQTHEDVIDQKPVPVIALPLDGEEFRDGTPIILDGEGSNDDGLGRYDYLVYTWYSNISGRLGSGEKIQVYIDEIGMHRITLYVDDGSPGHNVSTFVNITIKEFTLPEYTPEINDTDEQDPLFMVFAISSGIFLILIIVMVVLVLRYKKRREDEIKLDYKQRTEDDLFYEKRLEDEERSLGITVDTVEKTEEELEEERKKLYG